MRKRLIANGMLSFLWLFTITVLIFQFKKLPTKLELYMINPNTKGLFIGTMLISWFWLVIIAFILFITGILTLSMKKDKKNLGLYISSGVLSIISFLLFWLPILNIMLFITTLIVSFVGIFRK